MNKDIMIYYIIKDSIRSDVMRVNLVYPEILAVIYQGNSEGAGFFVGDSEFEGNLWVIERYCRVVLLFNYHTAHLFLLVDLENCWYGILGM